MGMDRVDTPPPGMLPPGMGGGAPPGMGAPAGGGSVSFAEPPGESKLLELERTLAAKDAVMEPEVLATLRDYVKSGGKAEAIRASKIHCFIRITRVCYTVMRSRAWMAYWHKFKV